MGLGIVFQMPFTGERFPANEVNNAFNQKPDTNTNYDTIIIGGSFAGLSAALGLGRCRRKVLMINEGLPRNRTSPQANNLFSRDGQNPAEIRKEAKAQLEQYQEYLSRIGAIATQVTKSDNLFYVYLDDGSVFKGETIVLATGVTDNLQDIDGLEELWGCGVYHCPYCHGWENREKKTVVIGQGTSALSLASTVSNWTDDITYYSQGQPVELPEPTVHLLKNIGITIQQQTVERISQTANGIKIEIKGKDTPIEFEACYAPGQITANNKLAQALGCEMRPNGTLVVDEQYMSTIEGFYAIGDVSSQSNGQVIHAAYSGSVAAVSINRIFINRKFT